ncbi:MerR family transcriptional regulator [Chromobacterium haemolyticum]|uniref:MerR family transcriptional regulator n=1 Tax=Chromobacterium haemolyticum TaxID=394935 RepID=UPI0005BE6DD0|nr:MerR family transcriptional regulator [Chromobacterium haemolyticum]
MKIGELAKRAGMAASAIRFYEAKGLLKIASRQANGYRDYPPEALTLLTIINDAQQAGFSLEEIKRLLPVDVSSWRHDELIGTLKRKVADIDAVEARLAQSKAQIQSLVQLIESKPEGMDCKVNAAQVMAGLGFAVDK